MREDNRTQTTDDRRITFHGPRVLSPVIAKHPIGTRLLPLATLLLAFFLRGYRLADKNIWWDEGWSIWLAKQDFAAIALRTAADEHPPLHYWMLRVWDSLAGWDAFTERFLSVAFGVLTIALIYRIGKRVGGAWVGILAALFLALARFHIWWSQDIKNYTPSIFFVFAAVWFALQMTNDKWQMTNSTRHLSRATRHIFLYALCAALAMWTHYLAALVLLTLNVYVLIIRRHSSSVLRQWIFANALAAILFAPWLILYLQNMQPWSAAPAFDFTLFLKLVATVLPLGVTTNIDAYAGLTIAFTTIAILGVIVSLRSGNDTFLFTLIVALPPLLIYTLSLTPVSFFAPKIQARYLLVLAPAYAILVALGIALLSRFSRYIAIFAFLFLLASSAFVLRDYYAERRLTDEYATLANTINAFARQGDLVLLDTDQEWPTFLYYLRAPLDWVGVPNGAAMTYADADAIVKRALVRRAAVWVIAIPDALATDPQKILETRLSRDLSQQYERTVGDKRLALYASAPRDFVNVAHEDFAPQVLRTEKISGTLQLLGFDLPTREVNPGDTLRVATYWRATYPAMVTVRVAGLVTTTLQMPSGDLMRYETDFTIPPNASGEFPLQVNQVEIVRIRVEPRAEIASVENIAHPTDYRFDEGIHLLGYQLSLATYLAGDQLPITIYWKTDHPIEKSYIVFVHLLGAQFNDAQNNFLWGQIDRAPRDGAHPATAWRLNQIVADPYRVPIAQNAPAGKYKVEVGLYDVVTGTRLKLSDGSDSVIMAEIEIVR